MKVDTAKKPGLLAGAAQWTRRRLWISASGLDRDEGWGLRGYIGLSLAWIRAAAGGKDSNAQQQLSAIDSQPPHDVHL